MPGGANPFRCWQLAVVAILSFPLQQRLFPVGIFHRNPRAILPRRPGTFPCVRWEYHLVLPLVLMELGPPEIERDASTTSASASLEDGLERPTISEDWLRAGSVLAGRDQQARGWGGACRRGGRGTSVVWFPLKLVKVLKWI
ncbi:hypothetical protein IWX92DRAFT_360522 [Phyllosticta citricarpa]